MRAALPTSSDYRAFEIVERVPPGCFTLRIEDDRHVPHLRPGEMAVVDPHDREYQCGEVYAIQQSRGPVIWEVRPFDWFPTAKGEPAVRLHPLGRTRSADALDRLIATGGPVNVSDGPLRLSAFQDDVIGRVIAIFRPKPRI
jgi:hypothetical protein